MTINLIRYSFYDMDKFGALLDSDKAKEFEKEITAKILFILLILMNK